MAKLSKLPLALYPHHDGSSLYVTNDKPKLLENVKLKVRIHERLGTVKEVRVRATENGEVYNPPAARHLKGSNGWHWYEATMNMMNPQMNYRFSIELQTGELYWLNALGLFETDQPDINDFRINIFSSAPEWGASTIMYQIFPDRFARSAKADQHRLPNWAIKANWSDAPLATGKGVGQQFYGGDLWGVIDHLDHLKKLGVTMIYLTPIFPGRSNHRYDASSFENVDPLLGGNEALAALIKAAHEKGFKIIGDLTSNHSGDDHEWFKAAYKNPKAPESDFYYFSDGNKKYESWFGVPSLPKFNWKSKELRKRFIEGKNSVVAKWLKAPYGFDGWRIDVANMTGRIRDEDMYLEVSQIIRKTMVDINPNTIMLGEYTSDAAYQVQGNGWQGAMSYANFTKPLWRWLWNPKNKGETGFMGNTSRRENGKQFVQSHTQFAAGYPWHVRLNNMNPLDTHDTPRFKTFTMPGAQTVGAAAQFTFPGIPVIWMGDEFGFDGINGENSRTPLPWNNERKQDKSMIEIYSHLASLRKTHQALTHGCLRWLYVSEEAVVYIRETNKESVLVALSRGNDNDVEFATDALMGKSNALQLFGKARLDIGKNKSHINLGKLSVGIWSLSQAK